MASIHLNAKDWELRYNIKSGIELRRRLGRPGIQIMSDIAGTVETQDEKTGQSVNRQTLGFDIEALVVAIQVGIAHVRSVNEDTLCNWVQAHLDAEKKLGDLINPVIETMLEHRCFGYKLDAVVAADEAESGKAAPPQTDANPSSTPS